jgi:hypothetical protein
LFNHISYLLCSFLIAVLSPLIMLMVYSFQPNSIFNIFCYAIFMYCSLFYFSALIYCLFHFVLNFWPPFLHVFYYYFVRDIIIPLLCHFCFQFTLYKLSILTHSLTHSLMELSPSWEAVNCAAFYETRRFITVFTRALHWSLFWAR